MQTLDRFLANTLSQLLISACLMMGLTANAQAETQRYQVEVIIFQNYATKGWTEEFWPGFVDTATLEGSQDLTETGREPLNIRNVDAMLANEAKKVARNYRLLAHKSWIQNALGKKSTPKLFLEGQKSGTSFYGTVKMYQSRYNHVEVEFNFDRTIPDKVRQEFADMQKIPARDLPEKWPFHLKAKRKVKSGELHYIDHPLFGILVQVQKMK